MHESINMKKIILHATYVVVLILLVAVIALLILRYQVEGETNMPFQLTSIFVISTAEGYQEQENKDYRWNREIYQNNDIYINIEKNKNFPETEVIKKIVIENIQIQQPRVGKIEIYRPNENAMQGYHYVGEYEVIEKLEVTGEKQADISNLKISNQGGTITFRVLNKTGRQITSNEEVFEHNGKLLEKAGITWLDIKTKLSFDLVIELQSGVSFKGTIELELPVEDIGKVGSGNLEITDFKNVIFKREHLMFSYFFTMFY